MTEGELNAAPLAPILCDLGYEWYVPILEESSVVDADDVQGSSTAARVEFLVDLGCTQAHSEAIVERIQKTGKMHMENAEVEGGSGGSGAARVIRTRGGIYSDTFLRAVEPLYDLHMGAENMGPILYSLVRFCKAKSVLEIGAGYTSIFLLQALADNAAELDMYRSLRASGEARCGDVPWSVDEYFNGASDEKTDGVLHIVDNMAHEHTTAHKVQRIAKELGCEQRLVVHVADAFNEDLPSTLGPGVKYFDVLWIDLGAADRIEGFFDRWWHRVNPDGGYVLVHSTLTNTLSRGWLEKMRALAREAVSSPYGPFQTMSFLEPHKMFQNSFSIFQRRGGGPLNDPEYHERVLTKYP